MRGERRVKLTAELGKPLVVTAFSLARDTQHGGYTQQRDSYVGQLLEAAWQHIKKKNHGALQGAIVWAWGGEGRTPQWTGDPPGELQGRLSVFDTDRSTTALLQGRGWSVP